MILQLLSLPTGTLGIPSIDFYLVPELIWFEASCPIMKTPDNLSGAEIPKDRFVADVGRESHIGRSGENEEDTDPVAEVFEGELELGLGLGLATSRHGLSAKHTRVRPQELFSEQVSANHEP